MELRDRKKKVLSQEKQNSCYNLIEAASPLPMRGQGFSRYWSLIPGGTSQDTAAPPACVLLLLSSETPLIGVESFPGSLFRQTVLTGTGQGHGFAVWGGQQRPEGFSESSGSARKF